MMMIVGAGLVGSLWAIMLRKKGYAVDVFERRDDIRTHNVGAGRSINLVITSRGLHGLEMAGIRDEVTALAVPVYGRMIHSVSGDQVYQAYGKEDEFNLSISRDALNRFLISAAEKAGAKFHFEHELKALDSKAKTLTFATGKTSRNANYETLFAADGAGSRVRKLLAAQESFKESTDWLEADYKELTLPLGPDGKAALETRALHIWPRGDHMMMALANQDGSFTATIYLPKKRFEKLQTRESVEQLFKTEFADSIPLMPNYVDEFLANPQGTLGTVRTSQWVFNDSIALMGDAAHAIVPFFGQGMNSGFEDCTTLFSLLEGGQKDWPSILREFERIQKPNADAIADMALENWVEMRDKVADQSFQLRKKVEGTLEAKNPTLYKSRYGLITYTLVPYSLAQKAGVVQSRMLDQLIGTKTSLDQVSWEKADSLLNEFWLPFMKQHQLKIENKF